ncbi:MAG: ASKHA domain-containing protein [Candidatus Marinimicrobia bacterium]|nr:ASKHA domain-containing protein [Candidatus Neomarinimicrobiota bacterium]
MVKVKIIPLNKTIKVKSSRNLGSVLQDLGFELPCGGYGTCGQCRIKVLEGEININNTDRQFLDSHQLKQGWRLACQHEVEGNLTIEVEQWEIDIENSKFIRPTNSSDKYGIAIDAGSTTIAGQLIDLESGNILMTHMVYNSQNSYGADIMTRLTYARNRGLKKLRESLLNSLYRVVSNLSKHVDTGISKVNIVGNTFIHHSFCACDFESLMTIPYRAATLDECVYSTEKLGWNIKGNPKITFLPNLGGFVGSDIMAGIFSTKIYSNNELSLLLDVGTNGEIVLGNREKLYFASTAAGPAFEGGKIKMGMRADKGAITHVNCMHGELMPKVKGDGQVKGICGSGLLDAVACGLKLDMIDQGGKIVNQSDHLIIKEPVGLCQQDIRELQLAKGAIAAGIEVLLNRAGLQNHQIQNIYLAGAFGNYLNIDSAITIGLLKFKKQKIQSEGNTALKGSVLSLFDQEYQEIADIGEHVELNLNEEFQEIFIDNMQFPDDYEKLL